MYGGSPFGMMSTVTGTFGIGSVVVGTLILIAIIAIFCAMC